MRPSDSLVSFGEKLRSPLASRLPRLGRFFFAFRPAAARWREIHQFGNTYYLYGTSYNCGFTWQTSGSPFCGFKSYSSTDLIHWTDNGLLFDISDPSWQTNCGGLSNGCFRPPVLYNSSTGKYVLWINDYSVTVNYRVFESTSPTGLASSAGQGLRT